jgi:hypothetical protein
MRVVMVHFVVVVMDLLVWFFSKLSKKESPNTLRTDSRPRLSAWREGVTFVVAEDRRRLQAAPNQNRGNPR